jgi:hypothetical protein
VRGRGMRGGSGPASRRGCLASGILLGRMMEAAIVQQDIALLSQARIRGFANRCLILRRLSFCRSPPLKSERTPQGETESRKPGANCRRNNGRSKQVLSRQLPSCTGPQFRGRVLCRSRMIRPNFKDVQCGKLMDRGY